MVSGSFNASISVTHSNEIFVFESRKSDLIFSRINSRTPAPLLKLHWPALHHCAKGLSQKSPLSHYKTRHFEALRVFGITLFYVKDDVRERPKSLKSCPRAQVWLTVNHSWSAENMKRAWLRTGRDGFQCKISPKWALINPGKKAKLQLANHYLSLVLSHPKVLIM